MAAPLSLCVITRDASALVGACLRSADFADDIVVVDSGSSDDTVEIARGLGARVLEQAWLGYGAQKNFAVAAAANDWVLCLDADERLTPELATSIRAFLERPGDHAGARCARRNRFLGRWLRHGEGYPDWNLRLFDRRRARWTQDPVHEHVVADGDVATLAGDLLHESAETLESYLAKQNRYTSLQAQAMFDRGERTTVARLVASPLLRFFRMFVLKLGFLDGAAGLVHIAIGCQNSMTKYAKLLALQQGEETE